MSHGLRSVVAALADRTQRKLLGPALGGEAARDWRGRRVYLAGRFDRREELRLVANELRRLGAEVTSRWLEGEAALTPSELAAAGRAAAVARMDFDDVRRADVCISFTEERGGPQGRGGRHTELGIALATGQRVIVVGPREHVFHCLGVVEHYETWDDARQQLQLLPQTRALRRAPSAALPTPGQPTTMRSSCLATVPSGWLEPE